MGFGRFISLYLRLPFLSVNMHVFMCRSPIHQWNGSSWQWGWTEIRGIKALCCCVCMCVCVCARIRLHICVYLIMGMWLYVGVCCYLSYVSACVLVSMCLSMCSVVCGCVCLYVYLGSMNVYLYFCVCLCNSQCVHVNMCVSLFFVFFILYLHIKLYPPEAHLVWICLLYLYISGDKCL